MKTGAKAMGKITLLLAAMGLAVLLAARHAQAGSTFAVSTTTDAPDADTMDVVCATGGASAPFMAAIEQANNVVGDDGIGYAPSVWGTIEEEAPTLTGFSCKAFALEKDHSFG